MEENQISYLCIVILLQYWAGLQSNLVTLNIYIEFTHASKLDSERFDLPSKS